MNAWLHAEPWSARSRKLLRSDVSNITHVEETYSKGKRDRDLESVRTPCLEEKICVSTSSRKLTWLFDKIAQLEDVYLKLKRTWKQEKREKRSSDMALFETNRELESSKIRAVSRSSMG